MIFIRFSGVIRAAALFFICSLFSLPAVGQSGATLKGTVALGDTGQPIHNVLVTIIQLKRTVGTNEQGQYEFQNLPAGRYDVQAHIDRVPDVVRSIQIPAGANLTLDFQMQLSGLEEQVTITATGTEQTVSSSIQSVEVIGSVELAKKSPVSLGEALDGELGVSKRSFGPGTARPVIRGFDGDRVLVLQDGNRVGGLGFQSGDHAEPVNLLTVERVEVVKGPATLLYGSNAIGGVVNAVTGHDTAHKGFNGYITALGSTNSRQAGGSGGVEWGTDRWLVWLNGGGQRSADYDTPIGTVPNSFSREGNVAGGFGYYRDAGFFSFNYNVNKRRYGIPFNPDEPDPEILELNPRRHAIEARGGFRENRSFVQAGTFSLQYVDYAHSEIDGITNEVGTSFSNKTTILQAFFDQRKIGRLSGRFGSWFSHRDFSAVGEEALAPPTKHNASAVFAVETLDFERLSLQFGGRIEHNRYDPELTVKHGFLPSRRFTGFSGALGVRVPTWTGGSIVSNYSHSYRAPSLEELYNNGPHPGNLAFEIGNPALTREMGNGLDFGVRHSSNKVRFEANGFFYHIKDFIFLAPLDRDGDGLVDIEDDLVVSEYRQGDTRYAGVEASLAAALHSKLWLTSGIDFVNAKLTETNTPLPRIPPLRGRIGLEFRHKGWLLNPELVMASDQSRLFPLETRTAGYTVFGVSGSYLIARGHAAHIISFNAFNLADRLYRNHLSFIKEFAPEMGRGLRVTYTLRFF